MAPVALAAAVIATACGSGLPTGTLTLITRSGRVRIEVEIAETASARARGLMGRPRLDPDRGMVFLFDRAGQGGFWMKDTLIPLSIAFWNRSGRIVDILDMRPCHHDPCPIYRPRHPYVGAVEVNLGFFRQHGVEVGDRVQLER
jgi:uncharacterized membrane protein (UPF0127 family)